MHAATSAPKCHSVVVFIHQSIIFASDCYASLLPQAAEIESLKQDKVRIIEDKDELEIHCQKQTEEASYARELASAAAVELRNLAEEVTKLSYQNAKLTADLAAAKKLASTNMRQNRVSPHSRNPEDRLSAEEFELELTARYRREASLVAALSERDEIEADLRKRLDDSKRHEEELENELANMWSLVAKKRSSNETKRLNGVHLFNEKNGSASAEVCSSEELKAPYQFERRKFKKADGMHSRPKVSVCYLIVLW